ncbi:acyl-CoA thioesterase [Flavihumibacter profundi]|jgi:acyl-CoA thioester hydrolase|uniref:acyl-CoA thioesterase n=1 Tax=Flavihumibacter profundi TaxID=2716883 RepID=UPI001CC564F4|nr:thioesterase family protein [Flavihumibacter profundi]MBZ5855659.1 thioesterase family protein [Flavihumibacter profundi]
MARIKLDMPEKFVFQTKIAVRITDLNYGGHVGNDTLLSLIHEARMQFLHHSGYTELNMAGAGLIMGDVAIEFKTELFYGDTVLVSVVANDFTRVGFDIFYLLEKTVDNKSKLVAAAKTGMVCYDYSLKKIMGVPPGVKEQLGL